VNRRSLLGHAVTLGVAGPSLLPASLARAAIDTTAKRDVVILQPGDVTGLDPHGAIVTADIAVVDTLFDPLVRRRPDGALHPALATSWRRTDATTWQFALREGVRWHDGTPFTSRDARYSLERTYDATVKAARLRPHFLTVERTEAPDPRTLVIRTRRPDPLIPAKLAFCGFMVPWAYIDRIGFTAFNERPVGTGPLRLVSWTRRDRCVFAANRDYWDGRLDLDRVILRPVSEPGARVDALLRGDADLITRLPPQQAARVASHPSTRVAGALYAGLYVLLVNVWVPPLNDPRIRQALSLAIDRGAIVRDLWRGRGEVPSGPIPLGDDHHDAALPSLPYDPRAARDLLRRAGYRDQPVVFETTVGMLANDKPMTAMIAEMWEDVGVNVVVEEIDAEARLRKYRQQSFKGLTWSDPTSILRHPEGMLGRLLRPEQPHDYWRHPEFDRLSLVAETSVDERAQADAYRRMAAIVREENPWIVVLQPYEDYGLRRHLEFTPSPDQRLDLRPSSFRLRRA
jgi:peptide/nickel transport system substrate-binding protein